MTARTERWAGKQWHTFCPHFTCCNFAHVGLQQSGGCDLEVLHFHMPGSDVEQRRGCSIQKTVIVGGLKHWDKLCKVQQNALFSIMEHSSAL